MKGIRNVLYSLARPPRNAEADRVQAEMKAADQQRRLDRLAAAVASVRKR